MSVPRREPKTLLIVRPTLAAGGADRVTITLLQNFDRTRVAPSLALFRREGPYLEDVPKDVPLHSLEASSLWTAWWPLARRLRRDPPDILLSTCSGANVVACLASLLSGRRARLVLSERNVLMRDQPLAKKWLMLLAKRLLYRSADAITAVSRGVADDLVDRLSLEPGQIRVVYNPIIASELETLAAEGLDEPPFDEDKPIVLAAGRLVPAKGFDVLLDAFAEVSKTSTANLVILGEGPQREPLRRQADRLGIGPRVHMPGFVKNPFKFMARATVFVLSSRFEGLPGVLIQAMGCGIPVVATRCPAGPEEIITHGRDGFLVPVDSSDHLAEQLLDLLDRPELRHRVGEAARKRSRDFRVDTVVGDYLRVILAETDRDTTASSPETLPNQPEPNDRGFLRDLE
jgi:glycosyltransferase involved in cell wall biosynthesis